MWRRYPVPFESLISANESAVENSVPDYPQSNLQVTVINHYLNYEIWRLLANPIFYDAIKWGRAVAMACNDRKKAKKKGLNHS